jgi:cephalosporin hydroxylase
VVEDSNKERDDFEVDRSREKFLFSFNPGGWLRKVR